MSGADDSLDELADLIERRLAGEEVSVPDALRKRFDAALAAHGAIRAACLETGSVGSGAKDRAGPPVLPADYEIVRELGRGGMGVVYLARQRSLGREVAVKVLRPGEGVLAAVVKRFEAEARHMASLRHANIVSIHEVGRAGDEPYFTMDYIDGVSLATILRRGAMPPAQAVKIVQDLVEGVAHAHARGVIHRDLKPANILLDRAGRAYVSDFGLARSTRASSDLTGAGQLLGTPTYMAPEQAAADASRVGEATDVHAIGAILYEALTGEPPFGRDGPAHVLARILHDPPRPPRERDRRIPRDLETICLKALAKAPEARYAGVAAMGEDLRRFTAGEPILARRPGLGTRLLAIARRHRGPIVAALAAAALVVALAPVFLSVDRSGPEMVRQAEAAHARGDHALATRILDAAIPRLEGAARAEAVAALVRCAGEAGDGPDAIEACVLALRHVPEARFGARDGRVALVLAERLERRVGFPLALYLKGEVDRAEARLVAARLESFLAEGGAGTPAGADAGVRLREIRLGLDPVDVVAPRQPTRTARPRAPSPAQATRERASAALREARALETSGDRAQALERARTALALARSAYPHASGIYGTVHIQRSSNAVTTTSITKDHEPDLDLLNEIAACLRRLDPGAPDPLAGGVRLHLGGLPYPEGLELIELEIAFWEASAPPPLEPMDPNWDIETRYSCKDGLRRHVSFLPEDGRIATLGMPDGTYRMALAGSWFRSRSSGGYGPYLGLRIDAGAIPDTFEVRGGFVDLPLVLYVPDEIRPLSLDGSTLGDLRTATLRWTPVAGALRYEVFVVATGPASVRGLKDGTSSMTARGEQQSAAIPSEAPELDLSRVDPVIRSRLARVALPGRVFTWTVRARDAKDRVIGAMEKPAEFIISAGWVDPPAPSAR